MAPVKKHLSLKPLINGFKESFENYKDVRREESCDFSAKDTALSVLACMFYKSKSLLNFQYKLKQRCYRNNLETQFDVEETPSDNAIRKIIASIPSNTFQPIFKNYLSRLQRGNHVKKYKFDDKYLIAIDATQYYTSENIHCSECLTQTKRNGKVEYSHKALQAIICHPDQKQILPMMPEPIKNEDGTKKGYQYKTGQNSMISNQGFRKVS